MTSKRLARTIINIFVALGLIFSLMATHFSQLIEAGFSTKIYYWTIRPYSLLTGIFPFSLAELTVLFIIVLMAYRLSMAIKMLQNNPQDYLQGLLGKGAQWVVTCVVIYLAFTFMWGLNYSRMTFAEISGLPVAPAEVEELTALALSLTERANELRDEVAEDHRGVMILSGDIPDMFGRAHLGYERAAATYPVLGGRYGSPKGVMLSPYWSYTGISGVYFPFTAEANINTHLPHSMLPSMLPFTTAHEMAHQRGFAREDEANYIAYFTSALHPDTDFQYSGVLQALTYTMNALYRVDVESWNEIRDEFSGGVRRDLIDLQEYRDRFQGPVRQASTRMNNTYLMANRQADGVYSYGRMVDLMLAEFRADKASGK